MSIDARRIGFIVSAVVHAGVVGALLLPGSSAVTSAPAERVMELSLEMFEVMRAEPAPTAEPGVPPAPLKTPLPPLPEAVPTEAALSDASRLPLRQTVNPTPTPTGADAEPSVNAPKRPLRRKLVDDRPPRRMPTAATGPEPTAPLKRSVAPVPPAVPAPRRAAAADLAPPGVAPDLDQLREAYLTDLIDAIHRYRFYPRKSRRRSEQGTVVVTFTLERNGDLTEITVKRSSGISRLDDAALETLRKLAAFRPIPAALRRDRWPMSVPIEYRLQ